MERIEAGYQVATQSLSARLWSKLGFGRCFIPAPDDDDNPEPFAPGRMVSITIVDIGWPDRLRLLISGRAMSFLSTQTDAAVRVARSESKFSVLAPGDRGR